MKRGRILSALLAFMIFFEMGTYKVNADVEKKVDGGEILKQICEDRKSNRVDNIYGNSAETQAYMKSIYLDNVMNVSKEYEEQYGGTYISDKNELVVMLTDSSNETKEYYENLVGEESVIYENCDVSMNELEEVYEYIVDIWTEDIEASNELCDDVRDSIVGVNVNTEKNRVCVRMKDCSEEKILSFREEILDSEYIIFEDGENYVSSEGYILKPGEGIYVGAPNLIFGGGYSIGFRCKRLNSTGKYTYGFVTAGHDNELWEPVYSATQDYIGCIAAISYENKGTVDAAYVRLSNSKYSCSIWVSNCSACLSPGYYVTGYATGSMAYKSGYKTGYTYGKITSTSATEKMINGITLKDVVIAEFFSFGGDSGGIVYMKIDGRTSIAGITVASNGSKSVFVKAANIKKKLGIVFY